MNTQSTLDRLTLAWARWAPRALLVLTIAVGCARPDAARQDLRFFKGGQSPLTMTPEEILNLELARLHEHVQPDGPVGVQWVDGLIESEHALAVTRHMGPGFLIQLDRSLTGFVLADTLVHEWAHALAPSADHEQYVANCGGHGAQWGIEFSRAYRAVWMNVDTPDELALPLAPPEGSDPCPNPKTPTMEPSPSEGPSTTGPLSLPRRP